MVYTVIEKAKQYPVFNFSIVSHPTACVPPVWGDFRENPPFWVVFLKDFKDFYDFTMIFAGKEGALYESHDSLRKPEKEERYPSVDARLLLHVQLLADGIYLLFP